MSHIDPVQLIRWRSRQRMETLSKDRHGNLPIHEECYHYSRPNVILYYMDKYPSSLMISSAAGSLPLHLLLRDKSSSTEIALAMIEKYPDALTRQIRYGDLPIHMECHHQGRYMRFC
jgi:hypothetical protein